VGVGVREGEGGGKAQPDARRQKVESKRRKRRNEDTGVVMGTFKTLKVFETFRSRHIPVPNLSVNRPFGRNALGAFCQFLKPFGFYRETTGPPHVLEGPAV